MVFRYANLVFSTPEPIFGPLDLRFGSGRVLAGLGTFFVQKRGPGKRDFVVEMVPHDALWGSVRGVWIVWYPGGLWAGPFPPKPS